MEFDHFSSAVLQYADGSSDTRNVMPGGNATLGLLPSNYFQRDHQLWVARAKNSGSPPH